MSLLAVVASLDSLDESVKGLYSAGTGDFEGKFVLQVEANEGLQLAPVTKLQNALQAARGERDDAQKLLKGFKDEEGNLLDITALNSSLGELESLKAAGGDKDELLKTLEENLKTSYQERERQLAAKHSEETTDYNQRLEHLQKQLHSNILVNEATKAITSAGGNPEVLLPHIERYMKAEEVDVNGEMQVKYSVVDPTTKQKRISTAAGSSDDMSLAELVGEIKENKTFASCFKAPASGTGGPRGGVGGYNNNGGEQQNSGQLSAVERMKASRQQS